MMYAIGRLIQNSALPAALVLLASAAVFAQNVPTGTFSLGTVRIPVEVLAGGERLPAGTYQLRMTGEQVEPAVPGQSGRLERYVEYLQGNKVVGKAVGVIVPGSDIAQVADDRRPAPGAHRVDRLKEDDYLRIWFNYRGDHILLHHPMVTADWLKRNP